MLSKTTDCSSEAKITILLWCVPVFEKVKSGWISYQHKKWSKQKLTLNKLFHSNSINGVMWYELSGIPFYIIDLHTLPCINGDCYK